MKPAAHAASKFDFETDDHWLAADFLAGHGEMVPYRFKTKYLKPNSTGERLARQALVRLLRSGRRLSSTLRRLLAESFDPDSTRAERILEFKFRKKGNRSDRTGDSDVTYYVASRIAQGWKKEAAVADACVVFQLTRKSVFEKLKRHREHQYVTSYRPKG
jgi:hypothetical protein